MLSVHSNSNERWLAKLGWQEERRQEMRAWSEGKGLNPPTPGMLGTHLICHGHIRPPGTGHEPIPT